MTKDKIKSLFEGLRVWSNGDKRAPHKPLLVLLMMSRILRGERGAAEFEEVRSQLKRLLENYGPPSRTCHPEYPFWYLQNDGVWAMENMPKTGWGKGDQPTSSYLLEHGIRGKFPEAIEDAFRKAPLFMLEVADDILGAHFPETVQIRIREELGLSQEFLFSEPNDKSMDKTTRRVRDPNFRENVLSAYHHCCAFCGYDGKIDSLDLGLEAAHIKWVQAYGPCSVENGLALCSLHHSAFDLGAIASDLNGKILISHSIHGRDELVDRLFIDLAGRLTLAPRRREWRPNPTFITWHLEQVFRYPAIDG